MHKKIIFIPGWMYSPDYFKLGIGLNVWKSSIALNKQEVCEYLIGHSMGAALALKIWSCNKDERLILINPFLNRNSILDTLINFLRYIWREGFYSDGFLGIKYLPRNLKRVLTFPEENYWEILKTVPKEKINILHGENDLFLCGNDVSAKFRKLGFKVIEIPEAGHNWHKNFDHAIMKIINK